MPELGTYGSVRGARGNLRSYRDPLWDHLSTGAIPRSTVRHAQHGAGFLAVQNQIRLAQQSPDVGACIMPDHRLGGVSQ